MDILGTLHSFYLSFGVSDPNVGYSLLVIQMQMEIRKQNLYLMVTHGMDLINLRLMYPMQKEH